jgi:hypothetical protein
MPLGSALGDEEPAGDLAIAQPERYQLGYLLSPPREPHLYAHEAILDRVVSGASLSRTLGRLSQPIQPGGV